MERGPFGERSLMLPRRFDKYELLRELGKGAFGTVYLAQQYGLEREVAIKILLPEVSHDEGFINRFKREAKVAASLRHPNITKVYDAAQVADQYYIAMEYVEGENLREMLDAGYAPDWRESTDIAQQLLRALEHAHSKNIIHRDIKPANILIEKPRRVVLTDFSIAHLKDSSRLTTTGHYLGTPEYIAPEILDGVPLGPPTDLYAVGLILYELVTGTHPFRGGSVPQVIKAQLFNVPKSPDELNHEIPRALAQVINQALLKDSTQRPQSAAEMSRMLREALDAKVPVVSLGPLKEPPPKVVISIPATAAAPPQSWPDPGATIPESPLPTIRLGAGPATDVPKMEAEAEVTGVILEPMADEPVPPATPSRVWPPIGRLLLVTSLLVVTAVVSFPPHRTPPTSAQTPAQATVFLRSQPDTLDLSLDGQAKVSHKSGETLTLSPGKHTLVGSLPGRRDQKVQVEVKPGQVSHVQFDLPAQVGTIQIHNPLTNVSMSVDGGKSEPLETSDHSLELPVGKHHLSFRRDHFQSQAVDLEVADAKVVEHTVQMEPKPAHLALESKPLGCAVWLNGEKKGKTPLKLELNPGTFRLKLSHSGYQEFGDRVALEPDQDLAKSYVLKKIPPPPKAPPPPPPPVYHYQPPAYRPPSRPYVPPSRPPGGGILNDRI